MLELCDEKDEDFDTCQLAQGQVNSTTPLFRNITRIYNETELQFTSLRQNFYYRQVKKISTIEKL